MTVRGKDFDGALDRAAHHARAWLDDVGERPVPPRADADAVARTLAGPLPDHGLAPADVVDELASRVEPGLMAIGSGRFFGWVMGGTLPAALGADWLVSAWDQNAGCASPRRASSRSRRRRDGGCSTLSACPRAPTWAS